LSSERVKTLLLTRIKVRKGSEEHFLSSLVKLRAIPPIATIN
jgi:hypothetical protein